jgi:large subunit ribosomal protein L21
MRLPAQPLKGRFCQESPLSPDFHEKNLARLGTPWCSPRPPTGADQLYSQTAMAYAVIKTGGKQYRIQEGDKFDVEKLDAEVDSEVTFDVLLVGEGDSVKIGAPLVEGASVTAKVINQYRGPKGVAFKFKRRKGFHKTIGFRRSLTTLEITSIAG